MKKVLFMMMTAALLSSCGGKANPDEQIEKQLIAFYQGDESAVKMSDTAKEETFESTWPEAQCNVEGDLYGVSESKDIRVVKEEESGMWRMSCVCPYHDANDVYEDCCIVDASINEAGEVVIEHVIWSFKDEAEGGYVETCTTCEGAGKIVCPQCKGTYHTNKTCPECNGVGFGYCCDETGKAFCEAKHLDGESKAMITCPDCNGTGMK